jgi:hypothetical protein
MNEATFFDNPWFLLLIILLAVWELAWKGVSMWRAARNGHKGWFVAILIINSVGILPIVYLLIHPKKQPA